MPQICGRVCPHEQLCQGACVRNKNGEPVLIGALEAFVSDGQRERDCYQISPGPATGKRVAVVGSGPASLACAEQLVERGHRVSIFEAQIVPGGLLSYGIPGFKLSKSIVDILLEDFRHAGVVFRVNTPIGKGYPIDRLFEEGFQAAFLGIGSAVPVCMLIPGERLQGVYPPDEFLARTNVNPHFLPPAWRENFSVGHKVVVVGGGDTAADCLRTALRLGAERVTCLYRRTEAEMPGGKKDRYLAVEEGAVYQFLTQPVRFIPGADGRVSAVECLKCRLGDPDEKGRRRPLPIEGSNFLVETDMVILALGYLPDPVIGQTTAGLHTHKDGLIIADPQNGNTSRPGIFAGGDAVTGPDLVVTAVAAGRRAAASIDAYLQTI
jgi:glutamate synthase (NADPH/NADH) small chain